MKNAGLLATSVLVCTTACMAASQWLPESADAESIWQDAGNTIKDETARNDVTPRIEFRCTPGDPSITANIDWGRFISSFSTEVGFKVDDGKFMWLKWKVDNSEQVTVSPSAEDSARLIEALNEGSTLTVDVLPYSEGPVVVTYNLAGFPAAIESLRSRCE